MIEILGKKPGSKKAFLQGQDSSGRRSATIVLLLCSFPLDVLCPCISLSSVRPSVGPLRAAISRRRITFRLRRGESAQKTKIAWCVVVAAPRESLSQLCERNHLFCFCHYCLSGTEPHTVTKLWRRRQRRRGLCSRRKPEIRKRLRGWPSVRKKKGKLESENILPQRGLTLPSLLRPWTGHLIYCIRRHTYVQVSSLLLSFLQQGATTLTVWPLLQS